MKKSKKIAKIIKVIILISLLSFNIKKIIKSNNDTLKTEKIKNQIEITSDDEGKIDIKKIKEINNDVIGWINIKNTKIDYPFVNGKDNKYYLNHDLNKKKNSAGWIFLDKRNNASLNNKNNIIYGHSMLNGTMFGTLKNLLKISWFNNKNNHQIKIILEKKEMNYQIFSVYVTNKENYYLLTNFNDDKEYKHFINILKKRSKYNFNISTKNTSNILTLSTCYKNNKRLVVHAKLIKES